MSVKNNPFGLRTESKPRRTYMTQRDILSVYHRLLTNPLRVWIKSDFLNPKGNRNLILDLLYKLNIIEIVDVHSLPNSKRWLNIRGIRLIRKHELQTK